MHFIGIDNKITRNNGLYAVLEDGTEVLIPVTRVPALVTLETHRVIYGDAIYDELQPLEIRSIGGSSSSNGYGPAPGPAAGPVLSSQVQPAPNGGSFLTGRSGVVSDGYGILGGNKSIMHHYVSPQQSSLITPSVAATQIVEKGSGKIAEFDIGALEQQRNMEIRNIIPTAR